MFPALKKDEWEPHRVIEKKRKVPVKSERHGQPSDDVTSTTEEVYYEEDLESDEGAVWPIQSGRITNWTCFFALLQHIHKTLNPPFHTPILLITQPAWTPKELERITEFFFEKFKMPGFAVMDAAQAACYAYGLPSAVVVDVGLSKADVTAISDFIVQEVGRSVALADCGGEAITSRLHDLLRRKDFSREMCEQLKRSPICEALPPGTRMPSAQHSEQKPIAEAKNPAALATTGADGPGANQRHTNGSLGHVPRGPGPNTEVGDERQNDDENEGILDVASIVTSGKMNDILAKKEKEKLDRLAARKKGVEAAAAAAAKPLRLKNSERETNTFHFEDHSESKAPDATIPSLTTLPTSAPPSQPPNSDSSIAQPDGAPDAPDHTLPSSHREIVVGVERFQALSDDFLTSLTSAIYRTILAVPTPTRRAELWDSVIVVGNGAAVRGFKETLIAALVARFLISPNSATIFTSELPSNLSTPMATGANTPQPQHYGSGSGHTGPNPLLVAATTASSQMAGGEMQGRPNAPMQLQAQLQPQATGSQQQAISHSSHAQTPTSIRLARLPEYFSEWKDRGHEEAPFLGAQVAAKVIFGVDQGVSKGYMTRPDFNEQGPSGIHDYCM